jgi:Ca-activated chloride channel family protein
MTNFRFESPLVLLLLIPVVAIAIITVFRRQQTVLYSSVTFLKNLPVTPRQRLRRLLPWLRIAGLILLVVALARPQLGTEETRIRSEGIAIQMCIDRSGSMQAMDFPVDGEQVNRLQAVKHVFRKFVAGEDGFSGRQDDLIGLIAFGGFASALCPPTLDHGALLDVLSSVKIPEPVLDAQGRIVNEQLYREEQSTAIGDALALAVDRLKNVESKSKVIVLLSDGENTAGVVSPQDAASAAAEFGIKVYSIGVGSNGMAPYPAVDLYGRTVLQQQPVSLDEEGLKAIAEATDGLYFNAKDLDGLQQVYTEIDKLEKTEVEGRLYTSYREIFNYPLLSGLGCVLITLLLGNTWLRGLPS